MVVVVEDGGGVSASADGGRLSDQSTTRVADRRDKERREKDCSLPTCLPACLCRRMYTLSLAAP